MKKLILVLALGAAFWQFFLREPASPVITNIGADGSVLSNPVVVQPASSSFSFEGLLPSGPSSSRAPSAERFRCDGRTHCSQMSSCAEATFFLRNCPGVKMDGNNDGVPCEQQWCR